MRRLQYRLNHVKGIGANVPVTGYFGPQTARKVGVPGQDRAPQEGQPSAQQAEPRKRRDEAAVRAASRRTDSVQA